MCTIRRVPSWSARPRAWRSGSRPSGPMAPLMACTLIPTMRSGWACRTRGDAVGVDQAGVGQVGVGGPDDPAERGEVHVGEHARAGRGHDLLAEEREGGVAGRAGVDDGGHAAADADQVGQRARGPGRGSSGRGRRSGRAAPAGRRSRAPRRRRRAGRRRRRRCGPRGYGRPGAVEALRGIDHAPAAQEQGAGRVGRIGHRSVSLVPRMAGSRGPACGQDHSWRLAGPATVRSTLGGRRYRRSLGDERPRRTAAACAR